MKTSEHDYVRHGICRFRLVLVCAFLWPVSHFAETKKDAAEKGKDTGNLTVKVEGLNNDKGTVRVALYKSKNDFMKEEKAFRKIEVKSSKKKASAVFKDLPYGVYGVVLFHDENGNKKLDYNMLGIPKEQYGCSNNPGSMFGAPDFDDAKFSLKSTDTTITINAK